MSITILKTQTLCWLLYASPVISGTTGCNMGEREGETSGRQRDLGKGMLVSWIFFENRSETRLRWHKNRGKPSTA
jgi:hypothetical protein